MPNLNKVMLIGHLGKVPESKVLSSGQQVATFSIATSEKWKDKAGEYQERTEWHNIVLWGKLAEIAEKYLNKGSAVYIEGKLQTRSWEDKDGNKKYKTEIVGSSLQILSSRNREESGSIPEPQNQAQADNVDDDLPF